MAQAVNLWKPEYKLDVDVIDEQHKGLFDLCLKSAMVCEAGQDKPVSLHDVIHMPYGMRAYAFRHFFTEEALMLKYGYPRVYAHIRQHDTFLHTLQKFTAELHEKLTRAEQEGQESFLALARKINAYLTDWWGEHILQTDQECLRNMEGRKKRPE